MTSVLVSSLSLNKYIARPVTSQLILPFFKSSLSTQKNMKKTLPTVVCVHHLDDFSGSPRVLANVVEGLVERGWSVELWTNRQSEGFLKKLDVPQHLFDYTFHESKTRRLLALAGAQWAIFRGIWKYRNRDVIIYVNTLLPFAAAFAGWLMGKKVVYHLHEATVPFAPLRWVSKTIARLTADRALFVSSFLKGAMPLVGEQRARVVPNGLNREFWEKASVGFLEKKEKTERRDVLMLCSLKSYKGIPEFVRLARQMPDYRFQLVLNATWDEIRAFFADENLPENLVIFPRQSNVDSFYREADVVLNLSRPGAWVESFGMTIIEAMAYGIPVIGPETGGPAEIIAQGSNGFCVDSADTDTLANTIRNMTENDQKYTHFREFARLTASHYRAENMQQSIITALSNLAD